MKKASIFAAIFILAVFALLRSWITNIEGAYFIVIGNNAYDIAGTTNLYWNKTIRSCDMVSSLDSRDSDWAQITKWLSSTGEQSPAKPAQILHQGNWYLAESDFESAEPGIFLMEKIKNEFVLKTVYGGTTGLMRSEPVIRDYLREAAPIVPVSLIRCFDPKIAPFVR